VQAGQVAIGGQQRRCCAPWIGWAVLSWNGGLTRNLVALIYATLSMDDCLPGLFQFLQVADEQSFTRDGIYSRFAGIPSILNLALLPREERGNAMWIVVTDLDGTLLNHHDYSWQGAEPALRALDRRGVPVVFCSSKTRAEIEVLRRETGNRSPFISENGGAVFLPAQGYGYLAGQLPREGDYLVIRLGSPYAELVDALRHSAADTGCRVRGFADATEDEVAAWCEFSAAEAHFAMQREYDEPFLMEDGDGNALAAAIEARGFNTTRGGRFWHILGANDKGSALRRLRSAFAAAGVPVSVAALGDSPNDIPLLELADHPIIIPGANLRQMQRAMPDAAVAKSAGSAGWNQAISDAMPGWFGGRMQSDYPLEHFNF
jgi:mannosyl-3-phosphoglycerate phosphatase